MTDSSLRLLMCPSCGGPLDPPAGESSMKCLYCGNVLVIPESLRVSKKEEARQPSLFSSVDMSSMVGYGTQWAEIVRLAHSGDREEAIRKYMRLTGNDESSARYMVNSLGGYQAYEFDPGSQYSIHQLYAPVMNQAADSIKSATRLTFWIGCGVTALILFILAVSLLPVLIGLIAGLVSLFQ